MTTILALRIDDSVEAKNADASAEFVSAASLTYLLTRHLMVHPLSQLSIWTTKGKLGFTYHLTGSDRQFMTYYVGVNAGNLYPTSYNYEEDKDLLLFRDVTAFRAKIATMINAAAAAVLGLVPAADPRPPAAPVFQIPGFNVFAKTSIFWTIGDAAVPVPAPPAPVPGPVAPVVPATFELAAIAMGARDSVFRHYYINLFGLQTDSATLNMYKIRTDIRGAAQQVTVFTAISTRLNNKTVLVPTRQQQVPANYANVDTLWDTNCNIMFYDTNIFPAIADFEARNFTGYCHFTSAYLANGCDLNTGSQVDPGITMFCLGFKDWNFGAAGTGCPATLQALLANRINDDHFVGPDITSIPVAVVYVGENTPPGTQLPFTDPGTGINFVHQPGSARILFVRKGHIVGQYIPPVGNAYPICGNVRIEYEKNGAALTLKFKIGIDPVDEDDYARDLVGFLHEQIVPLTWDYAGKNEISNLRPFIIAATTNTRVNAQCPQSYRLKKWFGMFAPLGPIEDPEPLTIDNGEIVLVETGSSFSSNILGTTQITVDGVDGFYAETNPTDADLTTTTDVFYDEDLVEYAFSGPGEVVYYTLSPEQIAALTGPSLKFDITASVENPTELITPDICHLFVRLVTPTTTTTRDFQFANTGIIHPVFTFPKPVDISEGLTVYLGLSVIVVNVEGTWVPSGYQQAIQIENFVVSSPSYVLTSPLTQSTNDIQLVDPTNCSFSFDLSLNVRRQLELESLYVSTESEPGISEKNGSIRATTPSNQICYVPSASGQTSASCFMGIRELESAVNKYTSDSLARPLRGHIGDFQEERQDFSQALTTSNPDTVNLTQLTVEMSDSRTTMPIVWIERGSCIKVVIEQNNPNDESMAKFRRTHY